MRGRYLIRTDSYSHRRYTITKLSVVLEYSKLNHRRHGSRDKQQQLYTTDYHRRDIILLLYSKCNRVWLRDSDQRHSCSHDNS